MRVRAGGLAGVSKVIKNKRQKILAKVNAFENERGKKPQKS